MIELRRFKLPLARRQAIAYDFERASVALLARHKCRRTNEASVTLPVNDADFGLAPRSCSVCNAGGLTS